MLNRRLVTLLVALIVVTSMLGCNNEAEQEARNKDVVIQAFDAISNQGYEALSQYFAQDYRRYCQASPEAKVESLGDMIVFLKEWYQAFPDATVETHMIAAEGDLVAVYITFAGTHEAPMGDIPATGKRMESETFGFHRLKDGKIVETWVTWDNVAILKQLGLFPPPTQDQL